MSKTMAKNYIFLYFFMHTYTYTYVHIYTHTLTHILLVVWLIGTSFILKLKKLFFYLHFEKLNNIFFHLFQSCNHVLGAQVKIFFVWFHKMTYSINSFLFETSALLNNSSTHLKMSTDGERQIRSMSQGFAILSIIIFCVINFISKQMESKVGLFGYSIFFFFWFWSIVKYETNFIMYPSVSA